MQDGKKCVAFISLSLLLISTISIVPHQVRISWGQTSTNILQFPSIVSTRDHFNRVTGGLVAGHNEKDYVASNIPGLQGGVCPPEIVIIVHGWNNNEAGAVERFDRAKLSLEHNNYHNPVVGFKWDSNTTTQNIKAGWSIATLIAKENGPKLAQFILDYLNACSNSHSYVRIIAHSLGSRVVLSALDSLHNNAEWNNKNFTIMSIHLLGAAVDDEEVSKDPLYIVNNASIVNDTLQWYDVYGIKSAYGKAIENEVLNFYNLFNPADTTLLYVYSSVEHDNALGLKGAQINVTKLSNYKEMNIQNKIPPLCRADGKTIDLLFEQGQNVSRGQDHAGYFGFRDPADYNALKDDGAINAVVRDWNSTLTFEKQDPPPFAKCDNAILK